jgi:hypothetical protein
MNSRLNVNDLSIFEVFCVLPYAMSVRVYELLKVQSVFLLSDTVQNLCFCLKVNW